MQNLSRILGATVLLVAAVFVVFGGFGGGGGGIILVVPLALIGGAMLLFRRSAAGLELGWAGPSSGLSGGTPAGVDVPVAPAPVPAMERPAPRPAQVSAALARVEARQWLSSPWLATGIAFCIMETLLFGWAWAVDFDGAWRDWFVMFPILAHPMTGLAVVGAHHAVTRGRRDGAEELFRSCPADEATRTVGHLRAGWVPSAVVVVFLAAASVLLATRDQNLYGAVDGRALADALAAVVLAAGGAALGVALGRWAPWRLAPVVFVAALVPVIIGLGNLGDPHWSNARQLSSWPRYPDHDLLFTAPPVWWHALWLAALGALVAVVAVAHARRNRRVLGVGLVVAVLAAGAGLAQTRPLSSGAAARLASLVAEPDRHQTCRQAGKVQVCAYRGYEGYLDEALPSVRPVAAALPPSVPALTLRHYFDGDLDVLGPEVAPELASRPARTHPFVKLGFSTSDDAMGSLRLSVSLAAVGLPVEAGPGRLPQVVAGQARGVAALWLAARGLDAGSARALATRRDNTDHDIGADAPEPPTAFDLGMAWPDPCTAGPAPVAWSAQDLAAARSLLAQPERSVHDLLLGDWGRFTDPATSTDDLLAAAGLQPVGPPDRIVAEPVECSY